MQVIGKEKAMQVIDNFIIENASHRQTSSNPSHWQGKCKGSTNLLEKMQILLVKKIQVIDNFTIKNASHRQIYYIKYKSLAKKRQIIDKFSVANASY